MSNGGPDLQALYRSATAPPSRQDCPSAETLAGVLAGTLPEAERILVADHLAVCAACADEYREGAALRSWAGVDAAAARRRTSGWVLWMSSAAAAVLVASLAGGIWSIREMERARQSESEARAQSARDEREVAALQQMVNDLRQPGVNPVIADLVPADATRGASSDTVQPTVVVVPPDAPSVAVILNTTRPPASGLCDLDVLTADGAIVWQGRGLRQGQYNTFSAVFPRAFLPAGGYRLVLREAGTATPLQEFALRLEYR